MMRKFLVAAVLTVAVLSAQFMKLTPEEFVVKPGVARYWKFAVTDKTGIAAGQFRASGGAHNDIRVLVADSDECENYVNGNRANVLFDSGQKTVGKVDIRLNHGNYCIIFDNRNSIVSSKEIAANIIFVAGGI